MENCQTHKTFVMNMNNVVLPKELNRLCGVFEALWLPLSDVSFNRSDAIISQINGNSLSTHPWPCLI